MFRRRVSIAETRSAPELYLTPPKQSRPAAAVVSILLCKRGKASSSILLGRRHDLEVMEGPLADDQDPKRDVSPDFRDLFQEMSKYWSILQLLRN